MNVSVVYRIINYQHFQILQLTRKRLYVLAFSSVATWGPCQMKNVNIGRFKLLNNDCQYNIAIFYKIRCTMKRIDSLFHWINALCPHSDTHEHLEAAQYTHNHVPAPCSSTGAFGKAGAEHGRAETLLCKQTVWFPVVTTFPHILKWLQRPLPQKRLKGKRHPELCPWHREDGSSFMWLAFSMFSDCSQLALNPKAASNMVSYFNDV